VSNEVVSWEDRLRQEAKEVAALHTPSVGKIGLRAGQMTYAGQSVPGNTINVVVLSSAFENAFYSAAFNPNKLSSPDCFALSKDGKAMKPDPIVAEPINAECDTCAHLQWGSDPEGGRGKACKESVRLALLPVGNVQSPEAILNSEIAVMKVPVTSVKNWSNYVTKLSTMHGRPPWAMITKVSVVTDPKTQFKVLFKDEAMVSGDLLDSLSKRISSADQVLLTPYESTGEVEEGEAITAKPDKKKKF
jgi:hypothetical protein